MKPPVDYVRVSASSKEILIKVKKRTGLEHWNEICRVALCRSLSNPTPPPSAKKIGDDSVDMEWRTFAGSLQEELTFLVIFRAKKDGIDLSKKNVMAEYLRSHLDRGIASLQNIRNLAAIYERS